MWEERALLALNSAKGDQMKDVIKRFIDEAQYHKGEAELREQAIKSLQEICKHDFAPDGHDSHHNYRRCKICNLRERC